MLGEQNLSTLPVLAQLLLFNSTKQIDMALYISIAGLTRVHELLPYQTLAFCFYQDRHPLLCQKVHVAFPAALGGPVGMQRAEQVLVLGYVMVLQESGLHSTACSLEQLLL